MGPSVHVLAKKYKQMAFTEVVSPVNFSNSQYGLQEPSCSKEEL